MSLEPCNDWPITSTKWTEGKCIYWCPQRMSFYFLLAIRIGETLEENSSLLHQVQRLWETHATVPLPNPVERNTVRELFRLLGVYNTSPVYSVQYADVRTTTDTNSDVAPRRAKRVKSDDIYCILSENLRNMVLTPRGDSITDVWFF